MARALVIGAGAIGRGFLPWVLHEFEIDFYDSSVGLVRQLSATRKYNTFMTNGSSIEKRTIRPRAATNSISELDLDTYDIAFIAVGPRNAALLPNGFSQLHCPVFSLENDPGSVQLFSKQQGLRDVYFGVPDVITSSSASPENLAEDNLALHTEDGVLYLEDSPSISAELKALLPEVRWCMSSQLKREWDAKLYLHNTPHCVAAYLGHLAGLTYLHEGFRSSFITDTVEGVIEEMLLSLKMSTSYDHKFMEQYAVKELRRFSNEKLFDPIIRVAREPLRKLHPSGRLTGALRLSMLSGVAPLNLMIGIAAALCFQDPRDADYQFLSRLHDFGLPAFLKFHLALPIDSLESCFISTNFGRALNHIHRSATWS